jgi:hypothetical protein
MAAACAIDDANLYRARDGWTLTIRRGPIVEHHALLAHAAFFGTAPECEIEAKQRALEILRRYVAPMQ